MLRLARHWQTAGPGHIQEDLEKAHINIGSHRYGVAQAEPEPGTPESGPEPAPAPAPAPAPGSKLKLDATAKAIAALLAEHDDKPESEQTKHVTLKATSSGIAALLTQHFEVPEPAPLPPAPAPPAPAPAPAPEPAPRPKTPLKRPPSLIKAQALMKVRRQLLLIVGRVHLKQCGCHHSVCTNTHSHERLCC